MRYLGTNFLDPDVISKDYPTIGFDKISRTLELLETIVDHIITKDFFNINHKEFLKKEDIACSFIHSIIGGSPQKSHWDYRPEDVNHLVYFIITTFTKFYFLYKINRLLGTKILALQE